MSVADRAARWLTELDIASVVDIGAGVGKFCVATALGCSATFTGLEHRPRLVSEAQALARLFGVEERVQFLTGEFGRAHTPAAECYYFFNPFGENLFDATEQLSGDVDLSHGRHLRDIAAAESFLASVPVGTYVLTYNGFGGKLPGDFHEVRSDSTFRCVLRLSRREAVTIPIGPSRSESSAPARSNA